MQFLRIALGRRCFVANRPIRTSLGLALLLAGAMAVPARGQWLLTGHDEVAANQLFDSNSHHEYVACEIDRKKPFLDFTLRFYAGYLVTCPFWVTEGQDTRLTVLLRVTPQGGKPVVLGAHSILRGSPAKELSLLDAKKMNSEFPISGGFYVGQGRYHVEVLVVDNQFRECRREWVVKVKPHQQAKSPVTLAPHTVSPLDVPTWEGARAGADGIRLTVLLEAPPIYSSRFDQMTGWGRVRLLQILSSLLEQTPCRSIRLVAFSLEQQKEIFRADSFKPSDIAKLQEALAQLEQRTVPVSTLQRPDGWIEMLTRMVNQEVESPTPSDAVVFLGRSNHWMKKLPPLMMKPGEGRKPRFFAFQRYDQWPDATAYVAKALGGTLYRILFPRDLVKATRKMVENIRKNQGAQGSRGNPTASASL